MTAEHLFLADDGNLFDTRNPAWSKEAPLRADYRAHHTHIRTVAEFKSTLRAGAFAWPGGYPLYFITSDGAALCFDCARKEARNIFESVANKSGDGWRVVACDTNFEDAELVCDHCNKSIPAAYVDSDDE